MEEIKRNTGLRLPALPKMRRSPLLLNAAVFTALGVGGYLALQLAGLVFRALGVD